MVLCNPPYRTRRRAHHDLSVIVQADDPDEALFVPGHDALVHYRQVLESLRQGTHIRLAAPNTMTYVGDKSVGGLLVFETPPDLADDVVALMESETSNGFSFTDICKHRDHHGMVRCVTGVLAS